SIEALSGKVFLLITGASRGIGRQIAITFGQLLKEGSRVLLLARNKDALQEVAKNLPSKVKVCTISADLSKSTDAEIKKFLSESLKGISKESFDRLVLVHNVGTMGDISQSVNDMVDVKIWKEFYELNFFVPAVLNAVVMNTFKIKTIKKTVINITSLYAIQAGASCGQYCSVKAAREMYFKVFALENPDVNVLNYAPGPVDTDMFTVACEKLADPTVKMMFNEMRKKKTVLTAEQTVNRLVQILKEEKYNSGDHVDYYDKLQSKNKIYREKKVKFAVNLTHSHMYSFNQK
ncbi:Sepiapterin reductase, partial [Cyphomyrmex costatus]